VASAGMGTTFPVTLTLGQAPAAARPGMAAEASFTFGEKGQRARFVVPPVAVGQDRSGRFVYVAQPIKGQAALARIKRRPVKVGPLTSRGLELTGGISEGELLVVAGVSQISDGLKVKLLTGRAK